MARGKILATCEAAYKDTKIHNVRYTVRYGKGQKENPYIIHTNRTEPKESTYCGGDIDGLKDVKSKKMRGKDMLDIVIRPVSVEKERK
jgi:hypothetical protein